MFGLFQFYFQTAHSKIGHSCLLPLPTKFIMLDISTYVESLEQHLMSLWKKLTTSKDYAINLLLSWLKKHRGMCVKSLSHDNEI